MTSKRLPTVTILYRFHGGHFDPDEITRRLGIKPTNLFRPGDPITRDGRGRRRRYGWVVEVGGRETIKIDDLLDELRESVNVSSDLVRKLCDDLGLELSVLCGIRQHESAETTPAVIFPPDFVAWVADMGGSIEVDVVL